MDRIINIIKRTCIFLIRIVYFPFLVIFSLWLIQILYFPHLSYKGISVKQAVVIPEYAKDKKMLMSIMKHREPLSYGHFHITDEYITRLIKKLDSQPPFCMICHGTYSHSKEKKTRALTNLHTGIMACEVCHIRKDPKDEDYSFTWVNLDTGKTSMKAEGGYGKYQAVIVPVKIVEGRRTRLDKIIGIKFPEYKTFSPDMDDETKKKLHEHLSKKPVACLECHIKEGYLDFAQLGFPQYRVNELTTSEVSRMIEHYETFYLPKLLRPR
jgi:hypothetical protein